jgi:hypothetical protein
MNEATKALEEYVRFYDRLERASGYLGLAAISGLIALMCYGVCR